MGFDPADGRLDLLIFLGGAQPRVNALRMREEIPNQLGCTSHTLGFNVIRSAVARHIAAELEDQGQASCVRFELGDDMAEIDRAIDAIAAVVELVQEGDQRGPSVRGKRGDGRVVGGILPQLPASFLIRSS